jgi:orotate phosphoribosyltransferase
MSTVASLIAAKLLKIKAIKLSPTKPFTWASGLKSPIYCDNRITLSYPEIRDFIKQSLNDKLWAFGEADVIAGVATAGIPHGALLADVAGKPFVYVRSKSKAHGRQNKIEGELKPGARVLVIEDLISTGMSSIAACAALRDAGAEVIGVLALFTYGLDKSKQVFNNNKIPLETLTNYRVLLDEAELSNYITAEEKSLLEDWNKDPEAWSKKAQ